MYCIQCTNFIYREGKNKSNHRSCVMYNVRSMHAHIFKKKQIPIKNKTLIQLKTYCDNKKNDKNKHTRGHMGKCAGDII